MREQLLREVIKFNDRLGLREMVRSLDYFRCLEYQLVHQALELKPGVSLLDLGAGKGLYPLFLAKEKQVKVTSLDIDADSIDWQIQNAERLGISQQTFYPLVGDSRTLPFRDNSFDRVLNLGSVEHIPEKGDLLTAKEMGRVLKPGGFAVFSIPYDRVYSEIPAGAHVRYFERRYDEAALDERIIEPSGLTESKRIYFGEPGYRWSEFWYKIPFSLKLPFRRLVPHFSKKYLRTIELDRRETACGICLVLCKDK